MPGNTAINALRYTLLTDAPANIQTATKNLADDIDTKLVSVFTTTAARDAAITVPSEGMLCYISGVVNAYYTYTGSAWEKMGRTRTKVKVFTEFLANSATPQNDNELFISVGANKTYAIHMAAFAAGDAGNDVFYRWTYPSGVLSFGMVGPSPATAAGTTGDWTSYATTSPATSPSINFVLGIVAAQVTVTLGTGVLQTAGVAGTLQLQWASAVAGGVGTGTNVYPGSNIVITEL